MLNEQKIQSVARAMLSAASDSGLMPIEYVTALLKAVQIVGTYAPSRELAERVAGLIRAAETGLLNHIAVEYSGGDIPEVSGPVN